MFDVAYAQGAGAAPAGGGFSMLIPLVLMFLVFYFLLIRPQQKKQRKHQDMLKSLKVGDKVITGGGLVGVIVDGGDPLLKLEIADKVRVEVSRGHIAGKLTTPKDAREVDGGATGGDSQDSGGFLGKLFGKR